MRKFNFDIDDWTGGNTLSNTMGDEIGKTVKPVAFRLITQPTNKFTCLVKNTLPSLRIDWGNGDTTLTSNLIFNKRNNNEIEYDYGNDDMKERLISVTILDDGYKEIDNNLFIFTDNSTKIKEYIIEYGINGEAWNFITFKYINSNDYKIKINISNNITVLNNNAINFDNLNCDTFIIPDTVTDIRNHAVSGIAVNKQVTIPKNCRLGTFAFALRSDPNKSIDLELPLDANRPYRFAGTSGFNLIFPKNITQPSEYAFNNIEFGKTFKFPSHIDIIKPKAFIGCTYQGDLIIPDTVKKIGHDAFSYSKIKGVLKLSNSLTEINEYTFTDSTMSGNLVIPDSVTDIKYSAFARCSNLYGHLVLGNNIKYIGSLSFLSTSIEGSVTIPKSVEVLGDGAFAYCDYLHTVYVPKKFNDIQVTEDDSVKVSYY